MTSTSPATTFAVAACGTIGGAALSLGALWIAHRARTDFRRVVCFEEHCTVGKCEMGSTFCPSCGCGPLRPEELNWYPARINHREAYTCVDCAENARAFW